MVVLDSDHREAHVLAELKIYSGLVSSGCYLIVEDTNPLDPLYTKAYGGSPLDALKKFLKTNNDFIIDKSRE